MCVFVMTNGECDVSRKQRKKQEVEAANKQRKANDSRFY